MQRICLAFALLAAACGNSPSNTTNTPTLTPSVSAIEPSTVFLGRSVDVHLAGFDTSWMDSTMLSFGDGITVNKVTAGSATGLTANITIDPAAATGARDVTVTDGMNSELFKASFTVSPPVKISYLGTVAQGSLSVIHVELLDHDNLFDTTNTPGFLGPPTYTNLAIKGPAGVNFQISSVTPTTADGTVLVDVDAAATTAQLDVESGPPMGGTIVHNQVPAGLTIAARTATPLAAGVNSGMAANPFDSVLYQLTPGAGGNVVQLALTGGPTMASPTYALLPKSGHFKDLVDFTNKSTFVTKTTDPYYVIFWDPAGASGYTYSLKRTDSSVNIVAENDANETTAMAQALTLPALVQGDFSSATDVDFSSFAIAAGSTGKKLHVTTFAGDSGAGQSVDVFGPNNGTTSIVNMGPVDTGGFVDFLTNTISLTGTYYVKLINSTGGGFGPPDPAKSKYNLWLRLE